MKNWMMVVCAVFLLTGCAKYTTPRKVERKISDGTWKISSFTEDGVSIAANYQFYTFSFRESGDVKVSGQISTNGSWKLGLNRNPAILYLSFPPVGGLEYLADDWQVTEMQKNRMTLQRNDDSGDGGKLVFKK